MENLTDFDSIFAALLTPIELPDNDNIEKLPPIHTLGTSYASNNLFSSNNNQNFMGDSSFLRSVKNEDNCSPELRNSDNNYCSTELSNSNNNLEDTFMEDPTWFRDDAISDSPILEREVSSPDLIVCNSLSEEEVIVSPVKSVKLKANKKKVEKKSTKKSPEKKDQEKISSLKKSPKEKRPREKEEEPVICEALAKKKRRTNYCFDIHRMYCPHSKKEKYYCNVTLQGKLQETVDLIKGKRGKYAYTFYDQRKQRKERRYWPSQSCGPVLEDGCHCKYCSQDNITKIVLTPVGIKREALIDETHESINLLKQDNLSKETPADDNCVLFLEEVVFLDM